MGGGEDTWTSGGQTKRRKGKGEGEAEKGGGSKKGRGKKKRRGRAKKRREREKERKQKAGGGKGERKENKGKVRFRRQPPWQCPDQLVARRAPAGQPFAAGAKKKERVGAAAHFSLRLLKFQS